MDERGAPQAARASRWCRHCGEAVTLLGQPGTGPFLRKAVHAATGREEGDDGHLAAPIDQQPPLPSSARGLEGVPR
jgi:hypothetical protein